MGISTDDSSQYGKNFPAVKKYKILKILILKYGSPIWLLNGITEKLNSLRIKKGKMGKN
jgi:hypothetical protein